MCYLHIISQSIILTSRRPSPALFLPCHGSLCLLSALACWWDDFLIWHSNAADYVRDLFIWNSPKIIHYPSRNETKGQEQGWSHEKWRWGLQSNWGLSYLLYLLLTINPHVSIRNVLFKLWSSVRQMFDFI